MGTFSRVDRVSFLRRVFLAALLVVLLGALFVQRMGAQTWSPLTNLLNLSVTNDSKGALRTYATAYSGTTGPLTALGNLRGRADSSGALNVTVAGGTITPDVVLAQDGTAAAPSYSFANYPNKGVYSRVAAQIAFAIGGVDVSFLSATADTRFYGSAPSISFGSTASTDVWLRRVGAKTLTLDADGANGALTGINLFSGVVNIGATDTGLSRLSAGVLGVGNGTAGDFSGSLKLTNTYSQKLWSIPATNLDIHAGSAGTLVRFLNFADNAVNLSVDDSGNQILRGAMSSVGGVSTTGSYGVPLIVAQGRSTAQTAAVASVATYTCTADCSLDISANVLVTASAVHSFQVSVAWTDEGNTARTQILAFETIGAGGTPSINITNSNGTLPYAGLTHSIRSKANTSITVATTGTFTSVTYNVEAFIVRKS